MTRTTEEMICAARHEEAWAKANLRPLPAFFVTKEELAVLMADLGHYRNDPPLPNQLCGLELRVVQP